MYICMDGYICVYIYTHICMVFPRDLVVKNLPAMQVTQVQSLGWEDPLEKGMATHSSILAWRIPWTAETVGYSSWSCKELDTTEQLTHSVSCICIHTTSSLSIHLLHGTGCFNVCSIVNSVVMNIGNHVPF